MITWLDGPMGTRLHALGVRTPPPAWSAAALDTAPDVVGRIHGEYAAAGATVHTAATFRTTARAYGPGWADAARRAVAIARVAVPAGHRVAGSLAPLEDCYRPDLSPADPRPEHAALARVLAEGCDLLLCEAFPHVGEAWAAVEAAVDTGRPVWASFTAGYLADLLDPEAVAAGARGAVDRGAAAVLVNCVPVGATLPYVRALADAVGGRVPVGAYANAGDPADGIGWIEDPPDGAARYAAAVAAWIDAGATIVGGCCGTGPAHLRAAIARCG